MQQQLPQVGASLNQMHGKLRGHLLVGWHPDLGG